MRLPAQTFCALLAAFAFALTLPASVQAAGRPQPKSGGGNSDADVPGEILVKLRSTDALGALLIKYSLTLVDRFGSRPIYRLKVIGGANARDVAAAMALEPDVLIAETHATHTTPEARRNQPWVIGTPGGYATQWAPQVMNIAHAHRLSTGVGVRVAVLDTGVDANHPLLAGHLLPGFDFVDFDNDPSEVGTPANAGFGHGTHVAGLVALVAPGAKIIPLRVLDADGVGNAWVLAEALLYAVDPDGNPDTDDGAHVINLSLGSLSRTRMMAAIARIASCSDAIPDDPIGDRSDPGYNDDNRRCARGNGAVIVAAAGNNGTDQLKEYPAAEGEHGLMAIAASNRQSKLALFSNYGSWVHMAAPGEGITSAVPGGYGTWSGTSMAAPLAAGTAALVRAMDITVAPRDVIRRLIDFSATLCGTNLHRVDATAAVGKLLPPSTDCR